MQRYGADGLQMINIPAYIHSLKLSWLKRMANSTADWAILAKLELPEPSKFLVYGAAKLRRMKAQVRNVFWNDVVQSLIHFNVVYHPQPEELISEPIWFSD